MAESAEIAAQVRRVASVANVDGFVMSLPNRYDTTVGERGVQLSGSANTYTWLATRVQVRHCCSVAADLWR